MDDGKNPWLSPLLVLTTAVWGWTFVVVHDAIQVYGVLAFLALRFIIASATLAPLSIRKVSKKTWRVGIAIGAILAIGYLLQTFGLRYTTPTNSGFMTGMFVVMVPLVDRVMFRIRIPRIFWAAVGVSLLGVLLLTQGAAEQLRIGDLMTLGAALAWAIQISLISRHAAGHDPMALAWVQVLTTAAICLIAWPFFEPVTLPPKEIWWALVVCGVLASALALSVQALAQRRLPAVRAAIIFSTEPLFAAGFGYWLAGDRLTEIQIVGAAFLIAAVAIGEIIPAWLKSRQMKH